MAANDEDYALQLHKQLNAIPLRTRRGQDLTAQPSFDRNKHDPKRDKGGKPRTKRTNSSSQDHPSSKKKRPSDPDDDQGHTSAHTNRVVKREPSESTHSHDDQEGQQHRSKHQHEQRLKPCDSRDSGAVPRQLMLVEQDSVDLHQLTPTQSAAAVAAANTQRMTKQQHSHGASSGLAEVKVFYAGVRWGLSLQPNAVRSRQLLAKALNDAFVGEIMSVGQGECLSVVFLDVNGSVAELGPTKWRNSKANTAQWKALAKTAARLYVSSPEASLYGML